jgi:hypothetical protein
MGQCNSMGLDISGIIPGSDSKKKLGLNVANSAWINGRVTTKTGFTGDGKEITKTTDNAKDGNIFPSGGSEGTTLGNTISINTLRATIKNGRPTFDNAGTISFIYNMPYASEISISKDDKTKVSTELASLAGRIKKLEDAGYATKTYVDNALNKKADAKHSHDFKYTTYSFNDKNGGHHTAISRIADSTGDVLVTIT